MAAKTINVGLVGHKFMGKAHSNAYATVAKFFDVEPQPVMKAICGRNEAELAEFAERFGWESYETDWRKLVARKDIDVVDIAAPGNVHRDIAVAAAEAGKHVFCEKPLAFNLPQAREMLAAVRKAGVVNMVNFNYRCCPALALAQRMIKAGEIGEVRHFRATYLQDWLVDPSFPMNWRLRKEVAGSGAHGDLNAHLVDLARFLVGEIREVVGMMKTFITERPGEGASSGLTATAGERHRESHRRRCVVVPGPLRRRRGRHVRSDADGPRPEEFQPRRDQRQPRLAGVQLRGHERAGVLQHVGSVGPAGLPARSSPPRACIRSSAPGGRRGTSSATSTRSSTRCTS